MVELVWYGIFGREISNIKLIKTSFTQYLPPKAYCRNDHDQLAVPQGRDGEKHYFSDPPVPAESSSMSLVKFQCSFLMFVTAIRALSPLPCFRIVRDVPIRAWAVFLAVFKAEDAVVAQELEKATDLPLLTILPKVGSKGFGSQGSEGRAIPEDMISSLRSLPA